MKHKLFTAKLGAAKVVALAGLSFGPFNWILFIIAERIFNVLANNGIQLINMGLISWDTDQDQKAYESAIEEAYEALEKKKTFTKEELDAIDKKVIAAFDKFVVFDKLRDGNT